MKKYYILFLFFLCSFVGFGQAECSTAAAVSEGTHTVPASPNQNYYWYEFTMPASGGKIKITSPDETRIELNSGCGGVSDYLTAQSYGDLFYTDAAPNEVIFIEVEAGNTESFDWTLTVSEFVDGDNCSLAVEAIEGTNNMPATEGKHYWYKFTMPNLDDARIYFDWPFMVQATIFKGDCNNLTDERNVLGGSGFFTTGYLANEELYIRLNLRGETNFDWTINVEVPEVGEDCNIANNAVSGINTLPATEMSDYWYTYSTPADVSGMKLQANAKAGINMSIYKSDCFNSSVVQERDSSVFAVDLEPETSYFFRFNNLEGGDFEWELLLTEPVAGDLCSDPIAVAEGQHNADFTPQWFSFTAPADGTYEISSTVETSDKDTILKLYDTCGGAIRAENDDAGSSTYQSEISLDLVTDETIIIKWESDKFDTNDGFDWNIYNASRQKISFGSLPEKTFGDNDFELSATSSAGLPVSYASSNANVATIAGSLVTIVGAGSTVITASQAGNAEYDAAIPVEQSLVVSKAEQEISISELADKVTTDSPFEVEASTTSELDLTYEVDGPASIDGTTITLEGTVGTVEVTVSQAGNENFNAATATASFEVREDPCLNFAVSATATNLNCKGAEEGSIIVEAIEGTAPFTYSLNGAAAVESSTFDNLAAGEYSVVVTDANGCTAAAIATISSPDAIEVTAEVANSTSILGNGSISITVDGGTGEFTYSWSNQATTASIEELEIGEYTVTVTDENGCSVEESYTVGGVTANDAALRNAISIFPNPARDVIQIKQEAAAQQLQLYDARGALLNEIALKGSTTELNVAQLPSGLYFIKTDAADHLYRFVKD